MRKHVWMVGLLVIAGLLVIGGVALAQGGRNTPNVERRGRMGGMWGNIEGNVQQRGRGMMTWGSSEIGLCGGTCTGHVDGELCDGDCARGQGLGRLQDHVCSGTCDGHVDGELCDGDCAGAEGKGLGRGLRRLGRTCDGTCEHSTEAK